MLYFLLGLAFADEITSEFEKAKQAIKDGKYNHMQKSLKKAYKLAGKSKRTLKPEEVSDIWFLEAISYMKRAQEASSATQKASFDASAVKAFRRALTVAPELTYTSDIIPAQPAIFDQVTSEISINRDKVDPCIPKQFGSARVFISGKERASGEKVHRGTHLAQVICPKGDIVSRWSNFETTNDWIRMCPYKFNLVLPCPKEDPTNPFQTRPDICLDPATGKMIDIMGTEVTDLSTSDGCPAPGTSPVVNLNLNMPMLIGATVSVLTAGTIYYLALRDRDRFSNTDPSQGTVITSKEDLIELRDSVNTKVYISAGLGVAGIGLYTAAFMYKGTF